MLPVVCDILQTVVEIFWECTMHDRAYATAQALSSLVIQMDHKILFDSKCLCRGWRTGMMHCHSFLQIMRDN